MEDKINLIIQYLANHHQTISMMESCTGGGLANEITNVEGASQAFRFGAVTYSNEAKIQMGVDEKTIETYTVYSTETARSMAKAIVKYADSNYGIGITGRFGVEDESNPGGDCNVVYMSIYNAEQDSYIDQTISLGNYERRVCKNIVLKVTIQKLFDLLFQN